MPISLLIDGRLGPASEPEFAWRKDREIRHESLWSLIHRFCALNIISGREFRNEFLLPKRRSIGKGGFLVGAKTGAYDLREFGDLNVERLGRAVGPHVLRQAIGEAYSEEPRRNPIWPDTPAPHLRYCPRCLARGVHMFFQQFECLLRCPVHGLVLKDVCPKCRRRIPFSLPREQGPFCCECGYKLWRVTKRAHWRVPAPLKKSLSDFGDWVSRQIRDHQRHQLKAGFSAPFLWKFNARPSKIEYPWAVNYRLPTIWAVLQPRCGALPYNFDERLATRAEFRSVAIPRHREARKTEEEWPFRRAGARSIYKSICRHFYRQVLRGHHGSLRAIAAGRHDYRGVRPRGIRLHSFFDPVAQAFAVWKCYWEWRFPEELFQEERSQITWKWERRERERFGERQGLSFSDKGLSELNEEWLEEEIHNRFIALKCLGTFEECLARIEAARRTKSVDYFSVNMIDGRYVPSMTVELQSDETVRLTWFWPAMRWLHSEKFKEWVRSAPAPGDVTDYVARLNQRLKGWSHFREFRWPKERPQTQYFLSGASVMEGDTDYSI